LIGKVGGSTADLPETSPASGGSYTGRKVFIVGSYAVVTLGKDDNGPLFLTMNDAPKNFGDHKGELSILVEEAPVF